MRVSTDIETSSEQAESLLKQQASYFSLQTRDAMLAILEGFAVIIPEETWQQVYRPQPSPPQTRIHVFFTAAES